MAERARARALEINPRIEEGIPILLDRWRIDGTFRETLERGFAVARSPRTG